MKILGIDPNLKRAAYVLLDDTVVLERGFVPNDQFEEFAKALTQSYNLDIAGIEMMVSQGQAVGKTVFYTLVWLGIYHNILKTLGHKIVLIPRPNLKKALLGKTRGNDSAIRTALVEIYGDPGTKKNPGNTYGITGDVWQALAVAHTLRYETGTTLDDSI